MTSPPRSPARSARPVPASSASSESPPLTGRPSAPCASGRRNTGIRDAEQAGLTALPGPLSQRMRTSPPRRNPLPPLPSAAILTPDLRLDPTPSILPQDRIEDRIGQVRAELEEMLATQVVQQPDAGNRAGATGGDEIQRRFVPALSPRSPHFEPSPRTLAVRAELEEMLATQVLRQPDAGNRAGADEDDEIRPRYEPSALPGTQERLQIPAGEASSPPTLPVCPTSPQLLVPMQEETAKKKGEQKRVENIARTRIEESAREALRNPAQQQALQDKGIALRTNDLDAQGRLVERDRKLTPLLEAAANKALTHLAGLSDADMSRLDRAVFMAAVIREQLGQVMAVDEQGLPSNAAAADPLNPGESAALRAPRRLAEPESRERYGVRKASAESGQLQRLAAGYAAHAARGLNTIEATHLRQRATGTNATRQQAVQLKLRDLSEHQGPLAVALVHKLFPPAWLTQQASDKDVDGNPKTPNSKPHGHRQALIEALQRLPPDVMDRLRAAAASPDPEAMAKACKEIEDAASELGVGGADLRHALMRLQGRDHEPAVIGRRGLILNNALGRRMPPAPTAYAGAPPADEALRWLRSNGPSSAQPMPER
jgi:hypothetical protein